MGLYSQFCASGTCVKKTYKKLSYKPQQINRIHLSTMITMATSVYDIPN